MSLKGASRQIVARQIKHFLKADLRYGHGVMDGLYWNPKLVLDVEETEGVLR
jgi:hypothetical protein